MNYIHTVTIIVGMAQALVSISANERASLSPQEQETLRQLSTNPIYHRLNMELVDCSHMYNAYMEACGEWTAHDILVRGPYTSPASSWSLLSIIDRSDKTTSCKKFLASIYLEMEKIKNDVESSSKNQKKS